MPSSTCTRARNATSQPATAALLEIDGLPMALAVCADFSQPSHPAHAARAGARLYIASALIGENGYPADSALLAGYAREHGMGVLLANHGGPTGGWKAAGRSAFWNERERWSGDDGDG